MFETILIANRGEIACRIIKTCRKLGIRTVAVYSDADADALHVAMADEAVRLGPPPAAQSYLNIEAIVEACRKTGAQAVHPGYGFLSERAAFARALEAAGITFIGPPAAAIEAMGDKIESKRLARAAGVSTVPGTLESVADPDEARRVAQAIGYPVMIKASAGGGGKGMRIARDERELLEGLARARSEARSSFGDDRVFLERFVEQPRHIEIQVLGDRHGNIVHLGERECSIQRRHQKVIEEAPSPFLDKATRRAMGEQAVALARAVGYLSAGTVEFIVDPQRNFYFLEMNTRLQVEHPVTELVTGLDLVELMIRVAAGEPLPFRQEEVRLEGWAIEARVYAEDPARGFLPSVGRLVRYREPTGKEIRVDSGVYEGREVSIHYDPMIAKLCARGPDRRAAIAVAREAIDSFLIRGPTHNLSFLAAVLAHPRFREGRLSTGFIAEEFGERFRGAELAPSRLEELAAVAVRMRLDRARRDARASGKLPGWRYRPTTDWVVQLGGVCFAVSVLADDEELSVLQIADRHLEVSATWRPGDPVVRARVTGSTFTLQADPLPEGWIIRHGGAELETRVRSRRAAELAARIPAKVRADTGKMLRSPMPGLILSVAVQPGDEVKAGQDLCVLEAMKMENVLKAEQDGRVEEVRVRPRDTVAADQVLIVFS